VGVLFSVLTQVPNPHALCRRTGRRGDVIDFLLTRLRFLAPVRPAILLLGPSSGSGEPPGLIGLRGLLLAIDVAFLVVPRLLTRRCVAIGSDRSPFITSSSPRLADRVRAGRIGTVVVASATPVMLNSAPKGSVASPAKEQRGVANGCNTAE